MIPPEMRALYFDFHWDNRLVWKLEAIVEEIPVQELEWQLHYPIWSASPPLPLFNLRPMDVIDDPALHPVHFRRLVNADLSYPIDLLWNKGRWVILDGFHRLARAKFEGLVGLRGRRHGEESVGKILR